MNTNASPNWNDPTGKRWKAKAICCNYDANTYYFDTWAEADSFREQFTSGTAVDPKGFSGSGHNGHRRAVIVEEASDD